MRLAVGQVWANMAGTKRTLVEAHGLSVAYYSGQNEAKTTTVSRYTFTAWILNSNAKNEAL